MLPETKGRELDQIEWHYSLKNDLAFIEENIIIECGKFKT
jgi:hypothetical protein